MRKYVCMHACLCVCVFLCVYACTHVCVYVYVCVCVVTVCLCAVCLRVCGYVCMCVCGGCRKVTLFGDPPIAGQSRSNRGPAGSNRGATLGIARFEFRRLISSAGLPAYNWKQEGGDVARMGRGSLVELVQSPSNRGPITEFGGKTSVCGFQTLPASRFGKHCLALHKRNQLLRLQRNACSSPRSQNQRDVRRHHATS